MKSWVTWFFCVTSAVATWSLEDFKEASDLFEADITEALDLESIVAARTTYGGTGNSVVAEQIELGAAKLAEDKKLAE